MGFLAQLGLALVIIGVGGALFYVVFKVLVTITLWIIIGILWLVNLYYEFG